MLIFTDTTTIMTTESTLPTSTKKPTIGNKYNNLHFESLAIFVISNKEYEFSNISINVKC